MLQQDGTYCIVRSLIVLILIFCYVVQHVYHTYPEQRDRELRTVRPRDLSLLLRSLALRAVS
jgi:hypothetical protein